MFLSKQYKIPSFKTSNKNNTETISVRSDVCHIRLSSKNIHKTISTQTYAEKEENAA